MQWSSDSGLHGDAVTNPGLEVIDDYYKLSDYFIPTGKHNFICSFTGTTTIDSHPPIWIVRDCDTQAHNRHIPDLEHQGLRHHMLTIELPCVENVLLVRVSLIRGVEIRSVFNTLRVSTPRILLPESARLLVDRSS